MREKILAELRKKFAGLPEFLLGQYADKLAATVTEESAIEGAVSELEKLPLSLKDQADLLQKESDRRVSNAQKEWEKKNPKPAGDPPKVDPVPDDAPAWAKTLITKVEEQNKTIAQLQAEKVQGNLTQQLHAKLAEKKIPAALAKGRMIEKPEDLDAVVAEIEADHTAYLQELTNQGLVQQGAPTKGIESTPAAGAEADIKAWAEKNNPKK
ncbi:hypothetical protein [Flaviaesturariibacter amylovorans]|uniref:PspA/IM30 family protein n=1 Tax=Flaviaesturariibacter amylovorans TaxID=1084520 RepID=A0ABP8GRI7_9BACT